MLVSRGEVVFQVGPHWGAGIADLGGFRFDLHGDCLMQDAKGGVHDVAAHVAQRARAKLPPATPVERMHALAFLRFLRVFGRKIEFKVRLTRFHTQPYVPVEIGRSRNFHFLERTLRPDWPIGPETDFLQRADRALIHPFFREPLSFHGAALIAHLRDHTGGFRSFVQFAHFPDGVAHRLLHHDVLLARHSQHRCGEMRVIGSGNGDGIDLVPHHLKHFSVVGEDLRAGVFLLRFVEVTLIHIDNGHDVIAFGCRVGIRLALAADADASDAQLVVGRFGGVRTQYVRRYECATRHSGGGGDEATTVQGFAARHDGSFWRV